MSDNNSGDDKPLSLGSRKPLGLKGGSGQVRQNFSRGRSNTVVVETKKRRFNKPGDTPAPSAPAPAPKPETQRAKPADVVTPKAKPSKPMVLNRLSDGEIDARRRALELAKSRESEDERRAQEEAKRRAEREARILAEKQAAEQERLEEEKRLAEQKAAAEAEAAEAEARAARAEAGKAVSNRGADAAPANKTLTPVNRKKEEPSTPSRPKGGDDRRKTKLTLTNALDENDQRGRSLAAMRRRQQKQRRASQSSAPREKVSREVTLPETITVQELSQRMSERAVDVIKFMMKQGQMMTPGDIIDADTAELIAEEFGHNVKRVSESDVEEGIFNIEDNEGDLQPRPPVVTIMGHVDHGKTSLLDAYRKTNVVSGEAGGITQHIGAYQVDRDGKKITFLDTPGHEAFTSMRARGAQATDVAILVVAADDSVMPQTIESINHAKAAEVPIIVAINKMDKPAADANKVRTELLQHEVFVESMGGETLDVEVSALKGTNLEELLDQITLQAELLELKANPDRTAEGIVVEAQLDKGRGAVATILVQTGTLKVGDIVVAGSEWGKVRAIVNDQGKQIKEAGPSMPVEILGLSGAPGAGDQMAVVQSEAQAREITEYRQRKERELAIASQSGARSSLEQMMTQLQDNNVAEVPVVLKGDVQGSVEAITQALNKLSTDEVKANVIHGAVGGITESDVALAAASNAPIIGFNVRANKQARDVAAASGIEIRYYNIIYDLVDDVKAVMSGTLAPELRETFLGNAEILEVFNVSKVGKVAGCRITDGKVERGAGVRLIRDNVVIHEGKLSTLKRFKDEVAEVPAGQECGMAFENYQDMRPGDVIECYRVEEIERSL
ncbi:MAG: translation initiation factor IF-2 [Pseudomonadota bacterium]